MMALPREIQEALEHLGSDQATDQVTNRVSRLLRFMGKGFMSAVELMARLGLAHQSTFRKNYLYPALESGFIEMKHPENRGIPETLSLDTERT